MYVYVCVCVWYFRLFIWRLGTNGDYLYWMLDYTDNTITYRLEITIDTDCFYHIHITHHIPINECLNVTARECEKERILNWKPLLFSKWYLSCYCRFVLLLLFNQQKCYLHSCLWKCNPWIIHRIQYQMVWTLTFIFILYLLRHICFVNNFPALHWCAALFDCLFGLHSIQSNISYLFLLLFSSHYCRYPYRRW